MQENGKLKVSKIKEVTENKDCDKLKLTVSEYDKEKITKTVTVDGEKKDSTVGNTTIKTDITIIRI